MILLAYSIHADEWLKNGDFSMGDAHWMGDGRLPEDSSATDPFASSDSSGTSAPKSLVVTLRPADWTKVTQDFETQSPTGQMTIQYQLSSDAVFSDKPEDYINVPNHIGFNGWRSFNGILGNWLVLVSDFAKRTIWYYTVNPSAQGALTDPHVYKGTINIDPHGTKTICLTFPPGHGKVTLTLISVKS